MVSLTSSDDWSGAFLPLVKHVLNTGDVANHLYVKSVTQMDDDEIRAYDEDFEGEFSFEELTQLGDGPVQYLVTVAFLPEGSEESYDYIIWGEDLESPDPEKKAEILDMVGHDLNP